MRMRSCGGVGGILSKPVYGWGRLTVRSDERLCKCMSYWWEELFNQIEDSYL